MARNVVRELESAEDVFVYPTVDADVDYPEPCPRAVAVGTSGTLKVRTYAGNDRILPAMPDGFVWFIQITKIYTGADTTATNVTVML